MSKRLLLSLFLLLSIAFGAYAEVTYPVAELANCVDQAACAVYCDAVENQEACTLYADANGLDARAPAPEVTPADPGPGGCTSEVTCSTYCDVPENQVACTQFAEPESTLDTTNEPPTTGTGAEDTPPATSPPDTTLLATPTTTSEDEKRADTIEELGCPDGACDDLESCRIYCDDPTHEVSCTEYSLEHDLLPRDQAEETLTVLTTPGPEGCTGDSCEEYCAQPGHEAECIEYAKKKGLIDPEEADEQLEIIEDAEPARPLMLAKPGGCTDRASCRAYCSLAGNAETCEEYALYNGVTVQTIGDFKNEVSAEEGATPTDAPVTPTPTPAEPVTTPAPEQGANVINGVKSVLRSIFN